LCYSWRGSADHSTLGRLPIPAITGESMIDVKQLRASPEFFRRRLADRGYALDLEQFAGLDERNRRMVTSIEQLRAKQNALTKAIGKAKSHGEDTTSQEREAAELGTLVANSTAEKNAARAELDEFLRGIPNLPYLDEVDSLLLHLEIEWDAFKAYQDRNDQIWEELDAITFKEASLWTDEDFERHAELLNEATWKAPLEPYRDLLMEALSRM
jgi:seryl-tRNA synthetase